MKQMTSLLMCSALVFIYTASASAEFAIAKGPATVECIVTNSHGSQSKPLVFRNVGGVSAFMVSEMAPEYRIRVNRRAIDNIVVQVYRKNNTTTLQNSINLSENNVFTDLNGNTYSVDCEEN